MKPPGEERQAGGPQRPGDENGARGEEERAPEDETVAAIARAASSRERAAGGAATHRNGSGRAWGIGRSSARSRARRTRKRLPRHSGSSASISSGSPVSSAARHLGGRVARLGEGADELGVGARRGGRRVDADGELRAGMEAVLKPGQLLEQVALHEVRRRVGDPFQADEDGADAFPQARDGGRVRLSLACPHGPFHAGADDTRLHSRPMVAQDLPAVLVADDDAAMRMLCRVNLELEGFRVFEADSGEEVERLLATEEEFALLLLDIHLGDRDGMDIARTLKETRPGIPVAFLTGSGLYSRDAADVVGDATIRKPFTLEELISTVTRLARSERSATSPSH